MEALTVLDAVRVGAGGLIATLGLAFIIGGAIGLLRFPDFYTRLHAAAVADGLGAALFIVGLAVMAPDTGMAVRLLLLCALIVALGPVLAHLLASAAHAGGLAPIAGRYTAPRPAASRRQEPGP
jgi:multicomponent Na+:H+ antiporter subunit G